MIQEQYTDQVETEISKFIGGNENKKYLDKCIKKEHDAKNKRYYFAAAE